ncbi:MAG: hypothetical protein ABFQ65_01190 [Nanoarchaeota archaeon]
MKKGVSNLLRIWFLIYFVINIIFAIILMKFPEFVFELFDFTGQKIFAYLVGAALFAIGGASFFSYKEKKECFNTILTLNLLWLGAAIAVLLCSIFSGESIKLWYIIGIFFTFFLVWIYYKIKLTYNK